MGYFLAEFVDPRDESFRVVDAGSEDLIFYCGGLTLCGSGEGFETVDDVVTEMVSSEFEVRKQCTYTSA